MKKKYALLKSEMIMKKSLKTKVFKGSAKKMIIFTTFQYQEHHNKIILLREKIGHYKKQLEPC